MFRPALTLALFALPGAFAQNAISVRSGLVHHVEGDVRLDGAPLKMEYAKFPVVQEGHALATEDGRAEVLLTPGAFLRLGDHSGLRVVTGMLTNTKVELVQGAALLEVAELLKDNVIAIRMHDSETVVTKPGLYLFDVTRSLVRVYDGKATVARGDERLTLGGHRQTALGAQLEASKFKGGLEDALYAWSEQRSSLMAQANISAANALRRGKYSLNSSMWAWYPSMGMFAFLPRAGYLRSPFGWGFYSPGSIWQYYAPRYEQPSYGGGGRGDWGGGGMGMGGLSRGGYSGGGGSVSSASVGDAGGAARASAPASAPAQSSPGGARGR